MRFIYALIRIFLWNVFCIVSTIYIFFIDIVLTWSNSLITDNYPAASERRHVLMIPPYKNNIYTPAPGVTNPVENRPCSEQFVFDGWIMVWWLGHSV